MSVRVIDERAHARRLEAAAGSSGQCRMTRGGYAGMRVYYIGWLQRIVALTQVAA